jgi:DnaJ-domain-containing protein 1
MFESAVPRQKLTPRPVVIHLRDGRRFKGVLNLRASESVGSLLERSNPFLTVRTSSGEIAIARDQIAAMMLGDREAETRSEAAPERPRHRRGTGKPRASAAYGGNDPCRILDVRPGASQEELKAAWRRRIQECHPDKIRGRGAAEDVVRAAQVEAAQVNAAYRTLMAMREGKGVA